MRSSQSPAAPLVLLLALLLAAGARAKTLEPRDGEPRGAAAASVAGAGTERGRSRYAPRPFHEWKGGDCM